LSGLVAACIVVASCAGDRSGGPAGRPEDVVARAVDVTVAAGTARITINAPAAAAQGVVDLRTRSGQLTVTDVTLGRPAALMIAGDAGYLKQPPDTGWTALGMTMP
jgi:hypothetical protein